MATEKPWQQIDKIRDYAKSIGYQGNIVFLGDFKMGSHGHGDANLLHVRKNKATIGLTGWVDEKGYGESAGGQYVKKKFPKKLHIVWGVEDE